MNSYVAETGVENLDKNSRLFRLLLGAGLIAFVMTTPEAPLGWYAVLPLLAIVPIFSALTGWDPIRAFFTHKTTRGWALSFSKPVRVASGVLGIALIGSVYAASFAGISLGLLAILPILGIYPVSAAIAGMDPITALYNLDQPSVTSAIANRQQYRPAFGVIHGNKTNNENQREKSHSKAA
ncbi:YgaP family membrane protein [Kaarinaea lacus]